MAERYPRLFSLPENLYAEGAPVILAAGALLKDNQTGKVLAQLKMKSISPKVIRSLTVCVSAFDGANRPAGEAAAHNYLDVNAGRNTTFGSKEAFALPDAAARSFSAVVTEVIFADGSVWTAGGAAWEPMKAQSALQAYLSETELVKQYSVETGSVDTLLPTEYKDLWFCSCGGINHAGEKACHYCHKEKSKLIAALDTAALRKAADKRLAEEEAEAERQRIEAEAKAAAQRAAAAEKAKKTKKVLAIVLPVAVVCVALVILTTKVFIPNSRYNAAVALMDAGDYEDAIAAFEALDGYKDSKEQSKMCSYSVAALLMDEGKYDEAFDFVGGITNYMDAVIEFSDQANNLDLVEFKEAKQYIQQKNYYDALCILWKLDTFAYSDVIANYVKSMAINNAQIGDLISFGSYEQDNDEQNGAEGILWEVVDLKDSSAMLVSKYILDYKIFSTIPAGKTISDYSNDNWKNCNLREWLNSDFYETAFDGAEKDIIKLTVCDNGDTYPYDECPTTSDHLFLMSQAELDRYYPETAERMIDGTLYADAQHNNGKNIWWLRTYRTSVENGIVRGITVEGITVYLGDTEPEMCYGVRPALWITIG